MQPDNGHVNQPLGNSIKAHLNVSFQAEFTHWSVVWK